MPVAEIATDRFVELVADLERHAGTARLTADHFEAWLESRDDLTPDERMTLELAVTALVVRGQ